ncbi:MAG: 4Fe-4S ferredoxin, partial [Symbiobacteriaceae bacterium]|nr:4Fe-4S ferredoxin [Symbiobacteriaceae bacterium]
CSGQEAVVRLPYELLPLPQPGQEVQGLSRDGAFVCNAKVLRVQNTASQDRTAMVWLEVPKEYAMTVRFFREV